MMNEETQGTVLPRQNLQPRRVFARRTRTSPPGPGGYSGDVERPLELEAGGPVLM